MGGWVGTGGGGGGGGAQGHGFTLFAFGSANWPLATAHSDPLWIQTCFGCVNGAPRCLVVFDYSGVGCPRDGFSPMPLTKCIHSEPMLGLLTQGRLVRVDLCALVCAAA